MVCLPASDETCAPATRNCWMRRARVEPVAGGAGEGGVSGGTTRRSCSTWTNAGSARSAPGIGRRARRMIIFAKKGNDEEYLLIRSKIRYTHGWDKINWQEVNWWIPPSIPPRIHGHHPSGRSSYGLTTNYP